MGVSQTDELIALPVPSPEAPPRPSLLTVLAAPWWLLHPRAAGETLVRASRLDFLLAYALHSMLLAVVIIGPNLAELDADDLPLGMNLWETAVCVGVLAVVTESVAVAALAWLHLPRVYRSGAWLPAFGRAFRAVSACFGLVTVLSLASYCAYLAAAVLQRVPIADIDEDLATMVLVMTGICLAVACIGRAVSAAERGGAEVSLPPRCEGCGYDLTHQPADGRCTECGLELSASLTPGERRPGSAWMRARTFATWRATTWSAVIAPRDFYRALRLRTPGADERGFAVGHYVFIALGAFGWLCGMLLLLSALHADSPFYDLEIFAAFAVFGAAAGLGCWLGHRVIGAAVASWWIWRGALADGRWAAKVIAYESAFLWVFCCWWGVFASSVMLFEDWMTELAGLRRSFLPLGMPIEAAVFLGGTFALGVVWLWRYGVARRAIQWSNF